MASYIKIPGSPSAWKTVTNYYVKIPGSPSAWKTVSDGYVKISGAWNRFFTSLLSPSIASQVTISRNNATYPSTLTGTNYHWTNSTSLTYVFQNSSDNTSWSNIGTATSISNPSSGSSNTVTYALTPADVPASTSYYRFVVTAVNSTYSTTTTSTSTSVSVAQGAPINTVAPTISPSSGTAGVTTYSVTDNGTWNPGDTDGVYEYQWQYNDQGTTYLNITGATSSSYSPPSNFLTGGYASPIRCRVTATNAVGSTAAYSNTAAVSVPTPSASTLTTTDSTLVPGIPSSITVSNTVPSNTGTVSWTNGSNATSSWVSSVTPGSSYTGTDAGTLITSQTFTVTGTATAVATVNNKNNYKRVTISWTQSNAASYNVNYTISNAGLANGTYNSTGNSSASSVDVIVTLGNVSGTVKANYVDVYSGLNKTGTFSTLTPAFPPSTSPVDKTSSNTGSGSVTYTSPAPVLLFSPTITPTSGTAGTTTYTVDSNGSWTNTPTSYTYQWKYLDQGTTYLNITGATSSSYSPPSNFLTGGYASPIRCYVTAINAGGSSTPAATNTATVSAPTASATAPTSVSVSVSGNVFSVSWSGATNATQYHIYWVNSTSTSANPAVSYDGSTTSPTTTIDFTLSYSSSYYFFVSAAGSNNVWTPYNSARSAQATSGAQITTPSTPTGVSATTTRSDGINITWNASSGATSYEIWWGGPPLDSYTPDFYPGNTTSYLDTSVPAGSSRTYYVRARNSSGASSWSSGASGTRTSGGSAPTSVSVSGNNSLAIGGTFSWGATGATSYNVTINGPSGNVVSLTNTSTTSYRPGYDGGWQGSGNYDCYVTAVNDYGSTYASPYPLTTFMN